MKKTLFLLMPLLVLSSCGANTQAKEEKQLQFKETTENVDEIFGEIEWTHGLHNRLAADAGTPIIGIQERTYTEDAKEYYAIRFVAALKDEPTSAIWTRFIYDSNKKSDTYGHQLNWANQTSHIYYDKLNNGASSITPEDEEVGGAGYTKFAIYTMYNIPIADAENYYIQAYVTVDGATSKVGVKNIRNEFYFDYGTSGYFLAVSRNGKTPSRVITPYANIYDSSNDAEFGVELQAGDKFIPVHIDFERLWTYDFETKITDKDNFQAISGSDMTKVKTASKYCMYLSKAQDKYYITQANGYYLQPGDWAADNARFALYLFNGDNKWWIDMIADPYNTGLYVAYVDPDKGYFGSECIFGRMNPATTENNFNDGVKWNQTGNETLTGHENQKFVIKGYSFGEWKSLSE